MSNKVAQIMQLYQKKMKSITQKENQVGILEKEE